jgi:DNA-binding response OmpR family regulator
MKKVLIIDDSAEVQKVFQVNLSVRGYMVLSALDGASGLEAARREGPDLIIIDLWLPDISGWDILRLLKNDSRLNNVPVFVMTASEGFDDEKKAAKMGAAFYFPEPFILRTLLSKIEEQTGYYNNK